MHHLRQPVYDCIMVALDKRLVLRSLGRCRAFVQRRPSQERWRPQVRWGLWKSSILRCCESIRSSTISSTDAHDVFDNVTDHVREEERTWNDSPQLDPHAKLSGAYAALTFSCRVLDCKIARDSRGRQRGKFATRGRSGDGTLVSGVLVESQACEDPQHFPAKTEYHVSSHVQYDHEVFVLGDTAL